MITTLVFDFSWVLIFPHEGGSASKAFHSDAQRWNEQLSINTELVEFVAKQAPNRSSYIFSGSSPHMLETLKADFVPPFTEMFSSKTLDLSKDNPESYRRLARIIGKPTQEILYTDDRAQNVDAAQEAGCEGIVFISTELFFSQVARLLKV